VRALFLHRRKLLRSVALSACKGRLDKPAVDEILGRLGLGHECRAEQLDLDAMFALSEQVRRSVQR
jgi:16S rRNA (adenine1518-N6/adenine1519-N6)-dimethyltransferase